MAIVLISTPGAPDANSFCSLAFAEAYHEMRGHNQDWIDASVPTREKFLVWATLLLCQESYKGWKTTRESALSFPRAGLVDDDGWPISSTDVPKEVQEACAEFAFILMGEDRTLDEGGLVEIGGKVGPINNPDRYVRNVLSASVRDKLRGFLKGRINSDGNIRVGRR